LAAGVPKELARKKMPVDHYSRMRAGTNLRNWLAFMTLRCDPKAQREIRMFANAVAHIIEKTFPNTYSLWAKEFFHTHA
jgi:thymidylate synthase (FAD)